MKWFYGPSDYNLLKTYEGTGLDETADLGWGIFGFLNRTVFYPVFNFLKGLLIKLWIDHHLNDYCSAFDYVSFSI